MFAIHFIAKPSVHIHPFVNRNAVRGEFWGAGGGTHKRLHVSLGDSFSTGLINCDASALRTNAAPSCQNRENLLNPVLNLQWFFCNALCSTQISDKWMECAAFCSGLWSMVKKSQLLPAAENFPGIVDANAVYQRCRLFPCTCLKGYPPEWKSPWCLASGDNVIVDSPASKGKCLVGFVLVAQSYVEKCASFLTCISS